MASFSGGAAEPDGTAQSGGPYLFEKAAKEEDLDKERLVGYREAAIKKAEKEAEKEAEKKVP